MSPSPSIVCVRCGYILPEKVDECVLCMLRGAFSPTGCTCPEPLPVRRYLGAWACLCGRMIEGG